MAKKKPTRSAQGPKQMPTHQEENSDSEQPRLAMDDSVEKLQSLKSLNDRLLKETFETRKEVGALVQTKEALELDLKRNVNEKEQVMGELSDARDGVYGMELERNVVCVYVQSHMEEMGGGISGLVESERVKDVKIGRLKAEIDGLVLKVEEEREKWRSVCCERDGIKADFAKLLGEKKESEFVNGTLMKENEMIKKSLDESGRVIEDLERKVDVKMKEKVEIEKEKKGLEFEMEKLEKEVTQLNESTFCIKQENKENEKRIYELEKRIGEAVEKERGMLMEVDCLVKVVQEKEKDMEMLTRQRDSLEVDLNLLQKEADSLRRTIDIITRDKVEMEEAKMEAENIIRDLQNESRALKEGTISLLESSNVEKAKNEKLLSRIGCLREALADARTSFEAEKESVEKLSLLIKDKDRRIEKAMNELDKADKAKIAQEEDSQNVKKAMQQRIDILVGERDLMEKSLFEAHSIIDELKAKVKSAAGNSEKAFALLKKTCLSLCDGHDKGEVEAPSELEFVEEMQPFVEHLDAIKTSFTNKEKMVTEMKRLLETERAEERKKKSFFTIVTAATTILAAVSAVYASKGR